MGENDGIGSWTPEPYRWAEVSVLSDDLNDHGSLPLPIVEIHQHDLLPGAERQLAAPHRNGLRRPDDRSADVRVSVRVRVQAIVFVVRLLRDQPPKRLAQV